MESSKQYQMVSASHVKHIILNEFVRLRNTCDFIPIFSFFKLKYLRWCLDALVYSTFQNFAKLAIGKSNILTQSLFRKA